MGKKINGEKFDGDVQFAFYEYKKFRNPHVKIDIRSLYVADHTPRVSGNLILNFVKKMTNSVPNAIATLEDASNVKVLALMTTGMSYYEHMGFHYVHSDGTYYVHRDGTRIKPKRNNFQKRKINATLLLSCISQKLDDRMQDSSDFDKLVKQAIL